MQEVKEHTKWNIEGNNFFKKSGTESVNRPANLLKDFAYLPEFLLCCALNSKLFVAQNSKRSKRLRNS